MERKKTNPVMLFSKPTCNFCKMAKEVLDGIAVEYCVEEIDSREDCSKLQDMFLKMTGERTVRIKDYLKHTFVIIDYLFITCRLL